MLLTAGTSCMSGEAEKESLMIRSDDPMSCFAQKKGEKELIGERPLLPLLQPMQVHAGSKEGRGATTAKRKLRLSAP